MENTEKKYFNTDLKMEGQYASSFNKNSKKKAVKLAEEQKQVA